MGQITLTEVMLINLAGIIFSAGVLWTKVNNVEKKLDQHAEHPERLARVETELQNLKNLME